MSNKNIITIVRKFEFCAAHKLSREDWSEKKNKEIFGKCSHPNFHGHNYKVWICLKGEIDPDTGMVYNLSKLKNILNKEIVEIFDHKNLNLDVKEFKNLIPTAENIALVIFERLKKPIGNLLHSIRLQETSNNFVEYCPIKN